MTILEACEDELCKALEADAILPTSFEIELGEVEFIALLGCVVHRDSGERLPVSTTAVGLRLMGHDVTVRREQMTPEEWVDQ